MKHLATTFFICLVLATLPACDSVNEEDTQIFGRALADLVIASIPLFNSSGGDIATATAPIANIPSIEQGMTATAAKHRVIGTLEYAQASQWLAVAADTLVIDSLVPGAHTTVRVDVQFAQAGAYRVVFQADAFNEIEERDETNNIEPSIELSHAATAASKTTTNKPKILRMWTE